MSRTLSDAERVRLEELFEHAADLPLSEREAFVERECGAGGTLHDELRHLLVGLAGEDVLGRLQAGAPAPSGTRIGAYRLLERIGEGGMGEVYAAEQLEPVARRVALKIVKPGMDSAQVLARFEAERQALARMTHPNIAQVYDGGVAPSGRPYFVMELVEGQPITEWCDRRELSTRERMELFVSVCEGVQHAHQKGVIHRDLKPSNLLVADRDGRPVVKVIDFGVARATSGRLGMRSLHTMPGQVVGTLDYMSPEQADPTGEDVDTRSDVYALGVVLYQLLSGLLPFGHAAEADRPLSEVQRMIREQDPPTPSTRLRRETRTATHVASLRGTDERALIRQLSGDLDWICLKALEKDPARRYASASELEADIRRHLADEPILAGRPGTLYRARKFVRRNRVPVAAAVLVTAGITAGLVGILLGWQRARALRPQADEFEARVLLEQVDGLWPAEPNAIPALEAWLGRARALVGTLPGHRARLARVEHEDVAEASGLTRSAADLLSRLVAELEELGDEDGGLLAADGAVPGRGWSVPHRLAFARRMREGFAPGGAYARQWGQVLTEIRAAYPGIDWPQPGLVPIGPDPDSKLWEFADLATGEPALRDANGRLVLTEKTGVVLVLLPGTDAFRMGPQTVGTAEEGDDRPARVVALSPFFLSKYELTQGQWLRLTGLNPSEFGPGGRWERDWLASGAPPSLLHPVETVRWSECEDWLWRVGLDLPSEAQWEYAARAGTETAWWSGPEAGDLDGVANLWDEYSRDHDGPHNNVPPVPFDDRAVHHWPVGSGRANGFGLHDVHGNVFEWCLDAFAQDYGPPATKIPLDPVVTWEGAGTRMCKGGSFRLAARPARVVHREHWPPEYRGHALGLRPARAVAR